MKKCYIHFCQRDDGKSEGVREERNIDTQMEKISFLSPFLFLLCDCDMLLKWKESLCH